MQSLATDTCVEVSPDVAHTRSGDQTFVLPLAAQPSAGPTGPDAEGGVGSPLALDGSASFVWQRLLDGPASIAELAEAAAAQYGVAVEQVRDDVAQFVHSLLVRGVVRRCSAG